MNTYNPNDIFIARRNENSSSFIEYVLTAVPNTIVTFDSASNLVAVPTQSTDSTSWNNILNTWNTYNMNWDGSPITSSYALSASYAPSVNSITSSYSSHALSASYVPNSFPNSLNAGQIYYTIIGDDANSSNITWYNTQGGLAKGRLNQRSNQELVWSANVNDLDQLDDTSLGAMKMSIYVPGNTFTIQTTGPQSSWSDGHNTPLEINLSTGNVGINQETPQFTLDVGGYIGNSQYNLLNYILLDDSFGNIKISAANDLSFSINRNISYNNNSIYGINRMYDTLGDYLDNYFNYNFVQGTQWQIQDSGQSSPLFYVQSKNNGTYGAVGTMNTVFDDGTGSMVIGNGLTVNNSSLFKLGLKTTAGDTLGPGVVEAQFGSTIPFYMMSDFPALGFNTYYNGGFVYGAGSSNNYASFQAFDPTSGTMIYYFSENAGNAGDIWPSNNIVLKFNKDGQVSIPSLSTPGYLTNDGNGTIGTVSSIYADIFDVNGSVGIAYGEPKYRLDIYGGVGNSQGDFPIQSNLGNNYNTIINNGGGNVGIGTSTPLNNLDVYGNVSFITNSVTINNSDPFYVNSNPTIVISSSNNTLGIQGALIIGSDGNAQHWSRINNDGTSDFAGSLIHFTSHGDGIFTSLTSSNGFAGTASYAIKTISASYAPFSQSYQVSSSYSLSSSYAPQVVQISSSWASSSLNAISSSYNLTSSYALNFNSSSLLNSASFVAYSSSANNYYVHNGQTVTQSLSSSFSVSASYAPSSPSISSSYSLSSSYAPSSPSISASYAFSASYAPFSQSYQVSASYANTASWSNNNISSSYSITSSNSITASYARSASLSSTASYVVTALTASYYNTGSLLQTSVFTTYSSSVNNYYVHNGQTVTSSLSASYVLNSVSASYAPQIIQVSSSYASSSLSSSYSLNSGNSISASYAPSLPSISSSYALSASYPHYSLITDTGTYVGINQTNPTYLLDVHGTLGNSYGNLFLQANGANVGIGTLSAQYLLDVKGQIGNSAGDLSLNSTANIQLSSSNLNIGMTGSLGITNNISASGAILSGNTITGAGYILTGSYTSIITGSYTLQNSDNGKLIQINSGSLSYITVPYGLSQGFNCSLLQRGTSQIVVIGSGGPSIYNVYNNSASYGQWAVMSLLQLDISSYLLQGATA